MASVVGVAAPWLCPACSVEVAGEQLYCFVCLRARPLPHQGAPQIFSGMHMHFNGIIPRTIKHPSHSVEWRMAERHGAICEAVFDPSSTNILVYRPGYERSDKVRLCVERYHHIPCVPIAWLLDSLLQSRQIHPILYRLQTVPPQALPTVRGPNLPHHQHPFYVMNAEEYSVGPLMHRTSTSGLTKGLDGNDIGKAAAGIPSEPPVPEAIWSACDVWEAAAAALLSSRQSGEDAAAPDAAGNEAEDGEKRHSESRRGVEIFRNLHHRNRVDHTLFVDMRFVLSESLQRSEHIRSAIEGFGGVVVGADAVATTATHVVYANDDKKESLMIAACYASQNSRRGELSLATVTWLEDCLMLGEVLPALDVYAPSDKLVTTLLKKWSRNASKDE